MKLIILVICIILQAFLNFVPRTDRFYFFDQYLLGMKAFLARYRLDYGWKAIIALLLPLLIIVWLLDVLLWPVWFLYFIYALIILLVSLDIRDLKRQLGDYFAAISGDNLIQAQVQAERFIHHSTVTQERAEMIRAVTAAIFARSLTGIFSVIFWFFVLGPVGAIMYYLVAAIADRAANPDFHLNDTAQTASYLQDILDWIPVRLVTLTFALIGHFGPVFNIWVERLGAGITGNHALIRDCGLTAIHVDDDPLHADITENQHALALINRTLWTWIIVIAVVKIVAMFT